MACNLDEIESEGASIKHFDASKVSKIAIGHIILIRQTATTRCTQPYTITDNSVPAMTNIYVGAAFTSAGHVHRSTGCSGVSLMSFSFTRNALPITMAPTPRSTLRSRQTSIVATR